jgi:hypothetical protein
MVEKTLDMAGLIFAWQDDSPDNVYYLDTKTGEVRLVNQNLTDVRDLTDEIEKNRERFRYLPKPDRGELISDLKDFMNSVQDMSLKNILSIAFESPHLLLAFKKILEKNPDELRRLDEFRAQKVEKRIQQWLFANHIPSSFKVDETEDFEEDDDFDEPENDLDFGVQN